MKKSFYNRDVRVQKGINNSQGAPVKLAGRGRNMVLYYFPLDCQTA